MSLWGKFKYRHQGRLGNRSCGGSLRGSARLPWLPLKGLSQGAAVLFEILQPGRMQPSPAQYSLEYSLQLLGMWLGLVWGWALLRVPTQAGCEAPGFLPGEALLCSQDLEQIRIC